MELKSSLAVPGLAEPSEPLATLTERGEDTTTPHPSLPAQTFGSSEVNCQPQMKTRAEKAVNRRQVRT